MNEDELISVTQEAIMLIITLSAPIMIIGLVVGVMIALFQALTQIQEMTLAFVPKMLAIFVAIMLMFPMMATALQAFTERLADRIINIG